MFDNKKDLLTNSNIIVSKLDQIIRIMINSNYKPNLIEDFLVLKLKLIILVLV